MSQLKDKWVVISAVFFVHFFFAVDIVAQTGPARIDSFQQAIKNAKSDTDKVNGLVGLSKLYRCNDSVEKVNTIKEALKIAENIHWKRGMVNAYISLGRTYSECLHNYIPAINYYQQAATIAKAGNDTDNEALVFVSMAQAYGMLNRMQQKVDCYRKVLSLKITPERRIGALSNMGGAYATLGDYTVALSCYDSALKVFDELPKTGKRNRKDDTLSLALLKMAIGDVYLSIFEYDHASHNYSTALSLFRYTKSKYGIIIALTGLGKSFHLQQSDEKAIAYYNEALDKCSKDADSNTYKNDRLIIYNLLGKLCLEKGMTDKALDYGQRSLNLIRECPDNSQVPVTYCLMGVIYTQLKKYDKAVFYLNMAISRCRRSGALDNEKDALQALSATYEQMKLPGKAMNVYKNYIAVRDSVYSLDKAKEITRHEMTADFAEKEVALAAEQDKKNAIQKAVMELTLKRQHFAYIAFTVIIILLLLVGFLLFNRFKLREKLEMQLAITGERSRISAEMHDDLGSELSKISLLSEIVKENAGGGRSQSHLDNISRSSRELLDRLGEIVWSLNNKYDSMESLVIYIRRYAMEYFSATEIDCKVTMPEHFPEVAIEGELRRNIFLVVKEALHNVLKHSKGNLVTVAIAADDRFLNINIQDNGVGVDLAAMSAFGNGLTNMKDRAERVKGKFDMRNQDGVCLNFNFPLPDSR